MKHSQLFAGFFAAGVLLSQGGAGVIEVEGPMPFFPEGRPLEGLVITLDAGHGGNAHQAGYTGSARGTNSRVVEGDLNMLVTATVRYHLQHAGARVHMTRWDDRKVTLNPVEGEPTGRSEELGARVALVEETHSHLFLSLHHNSAPRRTADGVVVLIWPTDSEGNEQPLEIAFADYLREEVSKTVHDTEEFGHYLNEHPLVMYSDIPSAVIEFGFLSNPEFDVWVSEWGSHVPEALGVYNAVLRMWTEHQDELEALRMELFPDAEPVQARRRDPDRNPMENLANRIWPFERPIETAEEAEWLLEMYKSVNVSDPTIIHIAPEVVRSEDGWILRGATSHPILREASENLLLAAGLSPVTNAMRLLPGDELSGTPAGIVQIPMALTWRRPAESTGSETQLLLGEPVFLLDSTEDGTYYLLQASEGYIGWVRREAVLPMTRAEFRDWTSRPAARVTRDYMLDDFRIPTGAILPIIEAGEDGVAVALPRGVRASENERRATIPREYLLLPEENTAGRRAAEAAAQFITTPYVFAGRSKLGLDCSGLVSSAYAAAGIVMPRDARQQILVGRLLGTSSFSGELRPGDLLYFLDATGRVSHMAMSLGGSRYIHSSPPHVHVLSLDPNDERYSAEWAERFVLAKRPVDP